MPETVIGYHNLRTCKRVPVLEKKLTFNKRRKACDQIIILKEDVHV
jgi:hypothetical protein